MWSVDLRPSGGDDEKKARKWRRQMLEASTKSRIKRRKSRTPRELIRYLILHLDGAWSKQCQLNQSSLSSPPRPLLSIFSTLEQNKRIERLRQSQIELRQLNCHNNKLVLPVVSNSIERVPYYLAPTRRSFRTRTLVRLLPHSRPPPAHERIASG